MKGGEQMRKQKGFTLIELLVVIAIIGLLATIAVVALNAARESARDSKRIADVRQVQTALEMYYNAKSSYPICTAAHRVSVIDDQLINICNAIDFEDTYLPGLDNIVDPQGSLVTCTAAAPTGCDYGYFTELDEYRVYFFTEGDSGSLTAGPHTASPSGIL